MALDHGTKRVGVAITDPTGIIAQPLETIERGKRSGSVLDRIAEIVREYEVGSIVVGLPLHMDGRSGSQADLARTFGDAVAERTGLRVDYLDERWTSQEAERALGEAGASPSRRRTKRMRTDPVAAAILLRTYLERQSS